MATEQKAVEIELDGVTAQAYPDALDDFELFLALSEDGLGSARGVTALGNALFGREGFAQLIEDLRDGRGRVSSKAVRAFLDAAMEKVRELKN